MNYKTFVSMNIAVIGTGATVDNYATRYAAAGHEVFMAWTESESNLLSRALQGYGNVHVTSVEDAAQIADLIIIACAPADVREVSYWMGDVRKKVIIDATANIHVANEAEVTTACAIKAITGSDYIVKVFTTRGYERLLQPLFKDEEVRLVIVGSSKKAKEATKILTQELGVHTFLDMGGDEAIPLFNELTRSWRQTFAKSQSTSKSKLISKHKL
jgi:predicted dinucleotide-binding enzyme